MEAMDAYLIDSRPEIAALFGRLMELPVTNYLPGLIEKEYMEKSQKWWRDEYIPQISRRQAQICRLDEIDEFIEHAANSIVKELDRIIIN